MTDTRIIREDSPGRRRRGGTAVAGRVLVGGEPLNPARVQAALGWRLAFALGYLLGVPAREDRVTRRQQWLSWLFVAVVSVGPSLAVVHIAHLTAGAGRV